MATSKTLTPTNVTIQIPEFTDQPDQRVNSNCIDKEADAINSLNTAIGTVNSALSAFEGQMCIVQTTDTATQNISEGQYVLWKGTMTKATQFIGTGGGLNSTRLPAVTSGGLNDLKSDLTTQEALAEFTGTSSQSVNLSKSANKYALLTVRVYNSSGEVCGVATAPPSLFKNLTYKIFGESSSQWGSFLLANDFASATFNRTSSNTQKISVYGVVNV